VNGVPKGAVFSTGSAWLPAQDEVLMGGKRSHLVRGVPWSADGQPNGRSLSFLTRPLQDLVRLRQARQQRKDKSGADASCDRPLPMEGLSGEPHHLVKHRRQLAGKRDARFRHAAAAPNVERPRL
jgi:hypothetical protein